jgi:hypothetical protein
MNNTPTAYTCPEADQIKAFVAEADATVAKAARWSDLRQAAESAQAAAKAAFLTSLDDKGAALLAATDETLRKVTLAADAVEQAGGPSVYRKPLLYRPEVFAAFAAGFKRKLEAIESLKKAATEHVANVTAEAIRTGEATVESIISEGHRGRCVAIRDASDIAISIEKTLAAVRYALTYAEKAGVNCHPQSFEDLLGQLTAPLPVLPSDSEQPAKGR